MKSKGKRETIRSAWWSYFKKGISNIIEGKDFTSSYRSVKTNSNTSRIWKCTNRNPSQRTEIIKISTGGKSMTSIWERSTTRSTSTNKEIFSFWITAHSNQWGSYINLHRWLKSLVKICTIPKVQGKMANLAKGSNQNRANWRKRFQKMLLISQDKIVDF